jgi:hypothetical protein
MMTPATDGFPFQRQTTLAAQPLLYARCKKTAFTRHDRCLSITKITTRCPHINATAVLKMYRPHGINFRTAC